MAPLTTTHKHVFSFDAFILNSENSISNIWSWEIKCVTAVHNTVASLAFLEDGGRTRCEQRAMMTLHHFSLRSYRLLAAHQGHKIMTGCYCSQQQWTLIPPLPILPTHFTGILKKIKYWYWPLLIGPRAFYGTSQLWKTSTLFSFLGTYWTCLLGISHAVKSVSVFSASSNILSLNDIT